MTLPASARRAGPYDTNGVTTAFGFTFKVFDEADVRVVLKDEDGAESDAVLNSDYTVSLNADQEASPGGNVNYLVALDGPTVTIVGNIEYSQPTQLPDGGAYRASNNMNALDRLAMLIQQIWEQFNRAIKFPVSDNDSLGSTLPPAAQRANKALIFDADGGVGVSEDDYVDQIAAVAASAASATADAAATAADRVVVEGITAQFGDVDAAITAATAQATAAGASATASAASETNAAASEVAAETAQSVTEAARDSAVAAAEIVGDYQTLASATTAMAGEANGKACTVSADTTNNGFYVKRSGTLTRESTSTIQGLTASVDAITADDFTTTERRMNSGANFGLSDDAGWAALLKPGTDVAVGAVRHGLRIPRAQVASGTTKIRFRLMERATINSESAAPNIGAPDVLIFEETIALADLGITAGGDAVSMDWEFPAPYTVGSNWIIWQWEAFNASDVLQVSTMAYIAVTTESAGQRGWYRTTAASGFSAINASFALAWSLLTADKRVEASALPLATTAAGNDRVVDASFSVVGSRVAVSCRLHRAGSVSAVDGSVAVTAATTGSVASEARTLSNSLSGVQTTYAYSPTAGQLANANVSSVVVTRSSDSVVLTVGVDYLLNADHGSFVRASAGADVPVTVAYSYAHTRYSLIYIDAETQVIGIASGAESARGAAELAPAIGGSGRIPLAYVRTVGSTSTVYPVWAVDQGWMHRDLQPQWDRDAARNRRVLRKTLGALNAGRAVDVIAYGDSIVAMQSSSPVANTANGSARDRATSTGGYLKSPSNIIPTSLANAVALYDTGDGAGAVHTRFGHAWALIAAMTELGSTVTMYNLGIGGTSSVNTSNGGTETAHLAAMVALVTAAVAANRQPLVIVNYGMNEIGNTGTEARMLTILQAIYAAGGEALVCGVPRRNQIDIYTDAQWRYTNRALRRVAEYVDPTTGKEAGFVDMLGLFADEWNVLGLHPLDFAGANYTNHPGIREMAAMSRAITNWLS